MTDQWKATPNTWLVFAILLVSAVYKSDLGGADSIYNAVDVGLIGAFVVFNLRLDESMLAAFAVPVGFLMLSVVANTGAIAPGGYRTAVAIAAGYSLFTLKPIPLNHVLLRRLMAVFLVVGLVLSLKVLVDGTGILADGFGNANFNGNPNSASLFFVQSIILALIFVPGWAGLLLAAPFVLLTVTTWSRAGVVCIFLITVGYSIFGSQDERLAGPSSLRRVALDWRVWVVVAVVIGLAVNVFPDTVNTVLVRFQQGSNRSEEWNAGLEAIRSWSTLLLGNGPATLTDLTGVATHNSYIEAIADNGGPFLLTTLIALALWTSRLARRGCRDMLWIVPPVLANGMVETILFNGIGSLWLVMVIVGIVLESRNLSPGSSRALLSSDRRYRGRTGLTATVQHQ